MDKYSKIFKAYDVRGIYPAQINAGVVARIAQAYAAVRQPKTIAVGRDVRASGEELKKSLTDSLLAAGIDVIDIGVITTDQLYFTVGKYGYDGGISVTASHNPGEYNGLKFAETGGGPVSSEDLLAMRDWAASDRELPTSQAGSLSQKAILGDYVEHVLGYLGDTKIRPYKVVANANFGAVGRGVDKIITKLGLDLERLNWEEDGTFPKGPPNPLLPENRDETIAQIKKIRPDLGVAWDADADRVFLFTSEGEFIPSPYIIALLSEEFLKTNRGAKIIHDITTAWVIDDTVKKAGGIPIMNRTGHTFIKARMRQEDAVFAGESSGHYYFKDNFYADNGIVPLLMILKMMSETGKSLTDLTAPLLSSYKISGEMNFTVANPTAAIKKVEECFGKDGSIDTMDGVAITTDAWRVSVRPSNTEPLLRLNAEAHDQEILDNLVKEISALINT